MSVTVIAYEEQPVTAMGLQLALREAADVELTGLFSQFESAIATARVQVPNVLLLGQPPAARSMQPILRRLSSEALRSAIIAWATELSDVECVRTLQAGARGVITRSHSVADLHNCILTVGRGDVWIPSSTDAQEHDVMRLTLSARELQVAELVARGLKNRDIAASLSITPGTVKVHLSHIFEKTGLRDRFQLALRARELFHRSW
ncbi:MAG TPA: response regulator transcription factor [Bryobacteraceae bacterium]|nr:response regulator transcription factor [Bryobacteraceae bacterium]